MFEKAFRKLLSKNYFLKLILILIICIEKYWNIITFNIFLNSKYKNIENKKNII